MSATTTTIERQPTAVQDAARTAAEQARWDRMQEAQGWADDNYLANPGFKDAAKEFKLSPYHFHREFARAIGVTFKDYVDGLRVAEAKRRILAGEPMAAVAVDVGWAHQSHFSSRFKFITGETPSAWLRRAKGEAVAAEVAAEVAAKRGGAAAVAA